MVASRKRKVLTGFVIFVLLVGIWCIDAFVYPFSTTHPNFSDVERVFNKMQFPADWKEVEASENRGTAGRSCPIESSTTCYHKRVLFSVENDLSKEEIEKILMMTGCPAASYTENNPKGGIAYDNYSCSVDGVVVSGTLYKKTPSWEASFSVTNR